MVGRGRAREEMRVKARTVTVRQFVDLAVDLHPTEEEALLEVVQMVVDQVVRTEEDRTEVDKLKTFSRS
jgi:transcription initiation factor IIF auxiliary subunit